MPSSQEVFLRLKSVCVPLLSASQLSPATTKNVLKLLNDLLHVLRDVQATDFILTPNLISYAFFPLSNILRRNQSAQIPDQVLERIFLILACLCEDWWWSCELPTWEQVFMLCGAIIGSIESEIQGKKRDEETKYAAAICLLSLIRPRTLKEAQRRVDDTPVDPVARLNEIKKHAKSAKYVPILGQTLDSILSIVETPHLTLQHALLQSLSHLLGVYASDDLIPTVLPGVTSAMTKVCIGTSKATGWTNGQTVSLALEVLRVVLPRAIGDDVCIKEGLVTRVVHLEDLAREKSTETTHSSPTPPYSTPRTPAWLSATSSQLQKAMSSLTPLVKHPTASALLALAIFSTTILKETALTLPQLQPLLLHFLLSLSSSDLSTVSSKARDNLLDLLSTPSNVKIALNHVLITTTTENLSALPRLLPAHSDSKVEHVAKIVEAVCNLAVAGPSCKDGIPAVSEGIGKLLGPTGGIAKWGWSLLFVLEISEPAFTVTGGPQLMLENDSDSAQWTAFPTLEFKHVSSHSTRNALEKMFHSLGQAAGDKCLFSVEWFINIGLNGADSRSVTAMWCACRLLEGVTDISVLEGNPGDALRMKRSKRLSKLARSIVKGVTELWEVPRESEKEPSLPPESTAYDLSSDNTIIQRIEGITQLHENLRIASTSKKQRKVDQNQPFLHRTLCLQLLAISAGIMQIQFTPLLLYATYPILHSLVSNNNVLSSTAYACLHFITSATSYASPANLLVSNFDYALDSVSRRLTRRWLDVEATKVLALMVRLVGSDIVDRAGDVVEECLDRLDEFHGYSIIVEGLVEVLMEVLNAIQDTAYIDPKDRPETPENLRPAYEGKTVNELLDWMTRRHEKVEPELEDFGPAPRRAWGPEKLEDESDVEEEGDPGLEDQPAEEEKVQTPIQLLTKQIVSRSLYFLTHGSPVIRARILSLLTSSAPILPSSAVLPSIHSAWPFILNRLGDSEYFVVTAAAGLVEALAIHFGSFMFRRIWDDVWPRFRKLLQSLNLSDSANALTRRGPVGVGTESAYTFSHRLYRSILKTMTAAVTDVHPHEASIWEVLVAFRRFLSRHTHEELQACARRLYISVGSYDPDVVYLVLDSTTSDPNSKMVFLRQEKWEIDTNAIVIFQTIGI